MIPVFITVRTDIEYCFPFGWSELEGVANRTDFDLKQHAQFSGKDLTYFDAEANKRYYPYIIEPSGGVDGKVIICYRCYDEDDEK